MIKEELQSYLEDDERIMEDRNVNKAKDEVALLAHFIGKDEKVKGKWSMNRGGGNYQNDGGRESQNSRISTSQKGESNCNICVVDQAITKVAKIDEYGKITRATFKATIFKSLNILLVNIIPTRMIHKNLK